eukprot:m.80522 g.80522  ORF g.80522 m.80522 type:complete len:118 (-) comp14666_c0_seq2:383-736(-)
MSVRLQDLAQPLKEELQASISSSGVDTTLRRLTDIGPHLRLAMDPLALSLAQAGKWIGIGLAVGGFFIGIGIVVSSVVGYSAADSLAQGKDEDKAKGRASVSHTKASEALHPRSADS